MKKTESLFVGALLLIVVAVAGASIFGETNVSKTSNIPDTKYGAFLAAQHAIYNNDFDAAAKYGEMLGDVDFAAVKNVKMMADFLSGRLPENAADLAKESGTPARLIFDAYLVGQGDWNKLYNRHKNDDSALVAPLRIISSVAINHRTEAIKFVNSLQTNDSWKSFVRGQIYAETGNVDKATTEFAQVRTDFMNINDYLYIMSFYRHHNLEEAAAALRTDFTSRPGGMFMLEFDDVPDWSVFSGFQNALAFSLVQNVSHTSVMMFSDLSILLLRFAQIIMPEENNSDAINYYIGQYFFSNNGDYENYFSKIQPNSPFFVFAKLREYETSGDITKMRRLLRAHPLFVPAMNKLIAHYTANGDKHSALRILNRAMKNDGLSDVSHAFLLKSRAQVYFAFGDLDYAQADIHAAAEVLNVDPEILALQAKIWAAQNRNLDDAYEYAMTLVQHNPGDVYAWDVLGRVVAVREGVDAALELIERVGDVAKECSSLFDGLGDLYMQSGNYKMAYDAYMRAIDLSGDGLVVVPQIQRKVRKLK
ncbi:MAG: hypothetical protein J5679_03690 [Alphaproteobacteria bacterium]|nr:hypothetical protein [Alphaproteobacteria bacterium]